MRRAGREAWRTFEDEHIITGNMVELWVSVCLHQSGGVCASVTQPFKVVGEGGEGGEHRL